MCKRHHTSNLHLQTSLCCAATKLRSISPHALLLLEPCINDRLDVLLSAQGKSRSKPQGLSKMRGQSALVSAPTAPKHAEGVSHLVTMRCSIPDRLSPGQQVLTMMTRAPVRSRFCPTCARSASQGVSDFALPILSACNPIPNVPPPSTEFRSSHGSRLVASWYR